MEKQGRVFATTTDLDDDGGKMGGLRVVIYTVGWRRSYGGDWSTGHVKLLNCPLVSEGRPGTAAGSVGE